MNDQEIIQGNWLYRNPPLFEEVNGYLSERIASLIWRELGRNPSDRIGRVLDVGCGTGRLLRNLLPFCDHVVGVDMNQAMLKYARNRQPEIEFIEGDMRSLGDLGLFDVVVCVGSVIMYMQSNDDITKSLHNLRRQVKPDGFLLLGLTDAGSVIGDHSRLRRNFEIKTKTISATAVATYEFDGRRQRMIRQRKWTLSTGETIMDKGEYRLIFPLELDFFLSTAGFTKRRLAQLDGDALQPRLFVVATP